MHVGKVKVYPDEFDPDWPTCSRHKACLVSCEVTEKCHRKCYAIKLLEGRKKEVTV